MGLVFVATAAWDGQAVAFEIAHTTSGRLVRWDETPVFQTSTNDVAMPGPTAVGALRGAAAVWNEALPAEYQIDVAQTSVEVAFDPHDGANSVVWMKETWDDDLDPLMLGATVRVYRVDSGTLVEADIALNGVSYDWSVGDMGDCQRSFDLQAVLTHELGHALGLNHNEDDPATVMFPSIGACQTKRALHDDDIEGVAFLYTLADPEVPQPYACSAAGGGAGLGWAFLIAVAMTFRRRVGAAILCAGIAIGAGATPSEAAVVRNVTLDRLAALSSVAVRGRVVEQHSVRHGGRVYVDTTLVVDDCLRGRCGDSLVIRQLGGDLDDLAVDVAGSAVLAVDDEVVVFLRRRGDGVYSPLGMAQGLFVVDRRQRGARATRDTSHLILVDSNGSANEGRVESLDLDALERIARTAK